MPETASAVIFTFKNTIDKSNGCLYIIYRTAVRNGCSQMKLIVCIVMKKGHIIMEYSIQFISYLLLMIEELKDKFEPEVFQNLDKENVFGIPVIDENNKVHLRIAIQDEETNKLFIEKVRKVLKVESSD